MLDKHLGALSPEAWGFVEWALGIVITGVVGLIATFIRYVWTQFKSRLDLHEARIEALSQASATKTELRESESRINYRLQSMETRIEEHIDRGTESISERIDGIYKLLAQEK